MKNIIKSILGGISWGCTIMVMLGILFALTGKGFGSMSGGEYIKQALCSMIVGIGFCVPSLAYQNERLSYGMQAFIHMGTGLIIYFPIAFYARWIPVQMGTPAIVMCIAFMLAVAFGIWFCFYLYYKNECKKINQALDARK